MTAGLKFEQAPPISVPRRFFVTAPAFALLAALVALWQGPDLYESRWSPATLAVTHLLTLGYATMAMSGALLQILPVLAGTPVARPRAVAATVHAGLTLGTLALAGGFLFGAPLLLKVAVALLGMAFAVFLGAMAASLARAPAATDTVVMLRLVAIALAGTAALGLWLAVSRGWGLELPAASLRDIHPAWGFLGWTGLLLAGVAYRVVPMFQITPPYPAWMARKFGVGLLALLALWSVAVWHGSGALAVAGGTVLAALYAIFAVITLRLQHRRRRRVPDVSLLFWRLSMLCVAASALLWVASLVSPEQPPGVALALGVLAIAGATLSVINGMLYKILPFLAWFHLQARAGSARSVPNVRQYLGERAQRRQFWLHFTALLLALAAIGVPGLLARAAALVFALSAAYLLANLLAIVRAYRRELATLGAAAR